MAALIERIANLAYKTFSDLSSTSSLTVVNQRLPALKSLVDAVTSADVALDERLVEDEGGGRHRAGVGAPVTYMHLWEDGVLSIGVFIVRRGMSIPLHDHPSMYGIVKVLHGAMHVRSYSDRQPAAGDVDDVIGAVSPSERRLVRFVESMPSAVVDGRSEPCVLTPTVANYHEITAVDGPVAFLDILAPPYDHDPDSRECHYYRRLDVDASSRASCLLPVGQPRNFWCDSVAYNGPKLHPDKVI